MIAPLRIGAFPQHPSNCHVGDRVTPGLESLRDGSKRRTTGLYHPGLQDGLLLPLMGDYTNPR